MLFLFKRNLNWTLHQTETEIMYFGKLISNVFQTINRGCDPRNEFWNDPVYQVGLSVYSNIYLKVEDYRTENKMHIHTEYE